MKLPLRSLTSIALLSFTASAILTGCTSPPPASEIIAIEGMVCAGAALIPNEPAWLLYTCEIATKTGGVQVSSVKVPVAQRAAFEAKYLKASTDAGK